VQFDRLYNNKSNLLSIDQKYEVTETTNNYTMPGHSLNCFTLVRKEVTLESQAYNTLQLNPNLFISSLKHIKS